MPKVTKYQPIALIDDKWTTLEGGPFQTETVAEKIASRYGAAYNVPWDVEAVTVVEEYKVEIMEHIRSYQPVKVLSFEDPQEARAKLQELGARFVPANLVRPDGSTLAVNYPNPFAGTIHRREQAEQLYNARNPEWVNYSSTF